MPTSGKVATEPYSDKCEMVIKGFIGYMVDQLKNGKWGVWEAPENWNPSGGCSIGKGLRMRDFSGDLLSFNSKEEAVAYANRLFRKGEAK